MCEYCEKPNKTITRHMIGVSAFVGAGRLLLRFDEKELDRTIVAGANIHYCPMCGRNLGGLKMKCDKLESTMAYKLTTNTEDSDVYIHNDEFGCGGDAVQVYIKEDVDEAIAELKDVIRKHEEKKQEDK